MAVRTVLKQTEKNSQKIKVKGVGLLLLWRRPGELPSGTKPHLPHISSLQGTTLENRLPQRHRSGSDSQTDWRCLWIPTQVPILITHEESQVLIPGRLTNTLISFLCLLKPLCIIFIQATSVIGLSGWAKRYYFSRSLTCSWGYSFIGVSDHAKFPHPFGKNMLSKVHACVVMNMEPLFSLPLIR